VRAIFLVAVAIFCSMLGVAHHWNTTGGGLFSDCRLLPTPTGQTGEWWGCRAGKLSGQTDLGRSGCDRAQVVGPIQLWSCPAPFRGSPST
jgi:hypothetical protein